MSVPPRPFEWEVEDRLAEFLERTGLFRVFRQVAGRALWTACPSAGWVRADLLLLASRRGLDAGWTHGPILLEAKRAGRPLGPGLSQLMDYLQCAWLLPNGVRVLATWGFLFQADRQHGPLASVLAHHRIGTASLDAGELHLWCGEHRVLTVGEGGALRVGETRVGRRFGGR